MILINNKTISTPDQKISQSESQFLYENLIKGTLIFLIPERLEHLEKNHKRNYKLGFLFELFSRIYPDTTNTKKLEIIADKFHLWFTYRQSMNVLNDYELNKKLYYVFDTNRSEHRSDNG